MRVAFLGHGNVGGALADRLQRLGHEVTVAAADPATSDAPELPDYLSGLTPGALAGNLVFMVEARGPNGAPLATLPAEVNMNVRYDDADVAGLNEAALIVSHLDQPGNAWRPAPKLIRDPDTNFLAASVTAMGAYAVHAP